MKESIDPNTLDLIYEVTRQGPPAQFREIESLDGKSVQIFSAASVVIGLTAISQTPRSDAATGLLILALAAYFVVALAALGGIWTRRTLRPYHSDTLLEDFWQDSADEVKYALAHELPQIYRHNQAISDGKANAVRRAIVATAVEVLAVGAMVIWTI